MAIKIINDKKQTKIKKKKKTVKPAKKTDNKKPKKSGYTVRNTTLTISQRKIGDTRIITGKDIKKKKGFIKKILSKILMLIFVVCLAVSGVYAYNRLMSYLCSLDKFFIDDIEITGCNNITPSEIINIIPFKIGNSTFEINLSQLEKDLKESKPELKDVDAYRTNKLKKVIVSLTERLPEVFIYDKEEKKGLDFDNKPFELRGNMSIMQVPVLIYNNEQEREDLLKFFKEIKVYLSDFIPEFKDIKYGELDDVVITMNDGSIIYWGLPKDTKIKEKSKKFLAVIKDLTDKNQKFCSMDLSFLDNNKDKIIVKLSNVIDENKI
ncbi:MAG: FtsQ-type POTRA domain-containing protein [Endomicrobiaceae bacterium]|nr:FtsQ-type POTRA domain-containing protein [Endomicrobiaceae bacterium]